MESVQFSVSNSTYAQSSLPRNAVNERLLPAGYREAKNQIHIWCERYISAIVVYIPGRLKRRPRNRDRRKRTTTKDSYHALRPTSTCSRVEI